MAPARDRSGEGLLVRAGLALAAWSERWFQDPFVFALCGVVVVFAGGLLIGESPARLAVEGGKSFWSLVPFTMQMVMIIVGGYVVASTPLVQRAIRRLARLPRSPRGAVAWVALLSLLTSLVSWGLSLVFRGLIPLTGTSFLWPSLATTAILIAVSVLIACWSAPPPERARTAASYGIDLEVRPATPRSARNRPGEWLDESPLLPLLVALLLAWYLVELFRSSPQGALAALDLPTCNLIFLTAGLLLYGRPRRFVEAAARCVPSTAGVASQYPFYALVLGMIVGTARSDSLARAFVPVGSPGSHPLLVAGYSTVLGILELRARDLVGYGMRQLIVHVPLIYLPCRLFAHCVPHAPPVT